MRVYVADKDAIEHNLQTLLRKAGQTPIWAVLKGNGYGLGVRAMGELCLQAGIRRFCVTELAEARALRELDSQCQILLLRPTTEPQELEEILALGVIATVGTLAQAAALNALASQKDVVAEVHVKIDTGMGRYGFLPTDLSGILSVYRCHDRLAVSGIYTHFHSAFCSAKATFAQYETFQAVVEAIEAEGVEPGTAHCCNSHAFLRWPELAMGGVRLGSALLGRVSCRNDLRRVGRCEASVDEVRWLEKGRTCGYGAGWKAKRPTRIAIVPVGWYHGFATEYGNDIFRRRDSLRRMVSACKQFIFPKKLTVTLGGKKCPVLGHVGMLHTVCDVTKVTCQPGDTAVLEISPVLAREMPVEIR